ncbi:hypothetical protein GTA08_BOTSDO12807 [Botryosphaeria dothidea]|uniref:Uncharacterized protein n=1 Tax=Botryosphaeria dothidea TaxID=55169 RepID=A0A8H4N730_9PEZI|nr:hypothetical protein GTA08_BOTSDO12807 [Botryosphaeria dothidea]
MLQVFQNQRNKWAQDNSAQGNSAEDPTQQDELKRQFTTMMHEFMKAINLDNRPSIDISPAARAQIFAEIQKGMQYINKLDQIMYMDWLKHRDDQQVKDIITVRHMLFYQLEPQTKKLKEYITTDPPQIKKILHHIIEYIEWVIDDHQSEKA